MRSSRSLLSTVAIFSMIGTTQAQTVFTWDTDPTTANPQDGGGIWDTTVSDNWWSNGNTLWVNAAPPNSAIFGVGGVGGVITVATPITVDDITFTSAGYSLLGGTITLAGTPTITTTADATISSALVGSNGLVKLGAGMLTIEGSSSNTYTGVTVLDAGTLVLGKTGGAFAISGPVQMGGGNTNQPNLRMAADNQFAPGTVMTFINSAPGYTRFDLQGTAQTLAGIQSVTGGGVIQNEKLAGGGTTGPATLTINNSADFSYDGFIRDRDGGAGTFLMNLVKNGAGKQTLTGLNITYTGDTTINAGTLTLSDAKGFASNLIVNAGGTLEIASTFPQATKWNYGKAISGNGVINKTGTGVFGPTGAITFNGTINVLEGRWMNDNTTANWTGSTADVNVSLGAVLDLRANNIIVDELNGLGEVWSSHSANGNNQNLTIGVANGSSTFGGIIRGNDTQVDDNPDAAITRLTKVGSGTFTLTGANTYSGTTTINAGTVQIAGADNRLPLATVLTVNGGATEGGTFNLNGLNQSVLGLDGASGIVPGIVTNNATGLSTLTVRGTSSFGGIIKDGAAGQVGLTKSINGVLTLSGLNLYSGITSITGGALREGALGAFSPNSNIQLSSGTLDAGVADFALTIGTGIGQVQWLGDGGFAAFGAPRNVVLNGNVPLAWGAPGFVPTGSKLTFGSVTGNETATLTNALDLGGLTRTVEIVPGAAAIEGSLGGAVTNGVLLVRGMTGSLGISGQVSANVIVDNSVTGSTNTMSLVLNRPGGNAILGEFQIGVLAAPANVFATARLGADEQIADTTVVTFGGPSGSWSYWNLYGFNETVGGLRNLSTGGVVQLVEGDNSPATNSTLTLNVPTGTESYFGHIRDRGPGDTNHPTGGRLGFVKVGAGTQALSTFNNQRWTGETTVRQGTLRLILNNGYSLPGAVTIDAATLNADATLELAPNAGWTQTFSGAVSGGHGAAGRAVLLKSNPGTSILTGANTFAGTTRITGGTLRIGAAAAMSAASNIDLQGGVLELGAGDYTGVVGTAGGQVQWTGSGGFSAFGGTRVVNLGGAGAPVTWGTPGFVPAGAELILSGANADSTVRFLNPIALGGAERTISSLGGGAPIDAELAGDITGALLSLAPGNATFLITGQIAAPVTVRNGTAATNTMQMVLQRPAGDALTGNLRIGTSTTADPQAFATVRLGANEQIADTAVVAFGATQIRWSYFNLYGFNETIAGLSSLPGMDGGVVQLVEADVSPVTNSTLTLNVASGTMSYLGHIRDRGNGVTNDPGGNGRLNVVKRGLGTQELTTWNTQVWTGSTTIEEGTLRLALGGVQGGNVLFNTPISVAAGAALDLANAANGNTWTINGSLTGAGNFSKSGASVVNLTGAGITYTGPTQILGGSLRLNDTVGFASSSINIAAGSALEVNPATPQSFLIPVSGAGQFVKVGGSTLNLGSPLTNTGNVGVRAGVLAVTAADQLPAVGTISVGGSGAATLNLGGFNQTVAGISGSRDAAARIVGGGFSPAVLTVNLANGENVFGGNFGGPGANENNLIVRKQGAGTLVVTGASSNTGGLEIAGGTVQLGASTTMPLPASAFSVWLDGTDPDATGVAPADGSAISAWRNKGALGAAGDFTAAAGLEPSYVSAGPGLMSGQPVVHFTATPTVGFAPQAEFDKLTNPIDLSNGPATIIVAGRYGGATADERKRLVTAVTNNWLLGWWNNGVNGAFYTNGFLPAVGVADVNPHVYSAVMRGDGTGDTYSEFGRIGGGAGAGPIGLALGGGANYAVPNTENSTGDVGELFIVKGMLADNDRAALEAYLARKWSGFLPINPLSPTGPVSLITAGATLAVNGVNQTMGSLNGVVGSSVTLGGGRLVTGNDHGSAVFDGLITGSGTLGKTGSGSWTITAPQTYTGTTLVENGTLIMAGGNNSLPVDSVLQLGGTPAGGVVRLSGSQTLSGLKSSNTPGSSRVVNDTGVSIALTVNLAAGNTNQFVGRVGGITPAEDNIVFRKQGAGVLVLAGGNTHSGGTIIEGGTLRLGLPQTMPTAAAIWVDATDGASITTAGDAVTTWTNKGTLGNTGNFVAPAGNEPLLALAQPEFNNQSVIRFDSDPSGGAPFDRLTNNLNFTSGDVSILYVGRLLGSSNQRLVAAQGNNWLLGPWGGHSERAFFGNNWVYQSNGADTQTRVYGGTISAAGVGSFYVNGNFLGSAPGMQGPNILSLGGGYLNNGTEYSDGDIGEFLLFQGVLSNLDREAVEGYLARKWMGVGTTNVLPVTGAVSLTTAGAALDVNGVTQTLGSIEGVAGTTVTLGGAILKTGDATDTTFAGEITGIGTVTKAGSGKWTLSGANSIVGGVTVEGGTLVLNGSLTGASVSVQDSATLAGSGTIDAGTAFVEVLDGGKLAPGNSAGTLTIAAQSGLLIGEAVTDVASGALVFELGSPAASDRIILTDGQLQIGTNVLEFGDFAFSTLAGFVPGVYTLFDTNEVIDGTLGSGLSGVVGGLNSTISFGDSNRDIILTVVPEPATAAILLGGIAMLASRRQRRRA